MIEQQRILATSIPGPRSQELLARKAAAVAAGVGVGLPVHVTDGAGGILRDVDGNQLIDLGSGIAVTTVGNAQRAGRRGGHRAGAAASPTPASWSPPTSPTSRSASGSTR